MNKQDEGKALQIALDTVDERTRNHPSNLPHIICVKDACLEMAKWKDEQFIDFLEWIDNVYVLRRFSDGESIDFKGLVEKFKLMQR